MPIHRTCMALLVVFCSIRLELSTLHAQYEIGYIERFALAEDRREALSELIPGTEDYYYYHCLHYQNQRQLADAEAILTAWRAKLGETNQVKAMFTRQVLLAYDENPQRALDYLRSYLNLELNHAPPSQDRAASLPTTLDNERLRGSNLLERALAADRSLSQIEDTGLRLLLDRELAPQQLRALLSRLDRADLPGLVTRIAEELGLKDSKGFGWAKVHGLLSLEQMDSLLQKRPQLLEEGPFIRSYSARLAPAAGIPPSDKQSLRSYLQRLHAWAGRLPSSQNSFKALVVGNLLRLNLSEAKYDRALFKEYLSLPRSAPYYNPKSFGGQPALLARLEYVMDPEVPLPAVGDDRDLVRHYLEHFLQDDEGVDDFSQWLDRDYLESVLAETKILYGIGDSKTWYARLSPSDQQALRERIEIRFSRKNKSHFLPGDSVRLDVELKNIDELIVRVYEINTLAYLRDPARPLGTDVDLDGLVANFERKFSYSQPDDLRHLEVLEFSELQGRGVWVIDLLGGGQRSRALIRKGDLIAVERLGDAGHVFQVLDEVGNPINAAHIEFGGRNFVGSEGKIILPYAEKTQTRRMLIVEGDFASENTFIHRSENYELQAGFLLDRQSLVAGTQASIAIHSRLTCNGVPISIGLLEKPKLTIRATDADGIQTSQIITPLELDDGDEYVHDFLVPQRLKSLQFELSGQVHNRNRDQHQDLSVSHRIACNGIAASDQIADFYLQSAGGGYRVFVFGRNGEPISRLPVTATLKHRDFKALQTFELATDGRGMLDLGKLEAVEKFTLSAQGVRATDFSPREFHRAWPAAVNAHQSETMTFPLGKDSTDPRQLSLSEIRRGVQRADVSEKLDIKNGAVRIAGLTPGDYLLRDFEVGQSVRIQISDGQKVDQFVVGQGRVLQSGRRNSVVLRDVQVTDHELVIEVDGADPMTRVHVMADVFSGGESSGEQIRLPEPPTMSRVRGLPISDYVDSLRLDEEYGYILRRRGAVAFPGNLLPQPSLLVHPWEVSLTETFTKQAAAGDALPPAAVPAPADAAMDAVAEKRDSGVTPDWKSFDFLEQGTVVLSNLGLVGGRLKIPLDDLVGFSSCTVLVVHPTSSDSRTFLMPQARIPVRDLRLKKSFDSEQHLTQTQYVEILLENETKELGDPRTRRWQIYSSLADVFQLYSTLLNDPEWEKFRFVGTWSQLSDEEKQAKYNEMACHELDFFLYHKDRNFFEQVAKPMIAQKLDKQLVDLWLLGQPMDPYWELWRLQRLNAFERILLAKRVDEVRAGTVRWFAEYLESNPIVPDERQRRFESALRGTTLDSSAVFAGANYEHEALAIGGFSGGRGRSAGAAGAQSALGDSALPKARALRRQMEESLAESDAQPQQAHSDFFGVERLGRAMEGFGFFQSLDKTREWAETQYYRVRLSEQTAELIPPNTFWKQYLAHESGTFLPTDIDLPVSSLSEALAAMAVIDLPFQADPPEVRVEAEQLVVVSPASAIVFLESIEDSDSQTGSSILVGQDIYLASPNTAASQSRPIQAMPMLVGTPYRANVVVTNPASESQRVQVLTQLPEGSLPLSGSKTTRSTDLEIAPYSTAQVQYVFYFPAEGEFDHYGAQISHQSNHLANTESSRLRVLAEPESVDEQTWAYVASWGTNEQVLAFLRDSNLQQIDLSLIAFRMVDRDVYDQVLSILSESGRFDPTLWAYAVRHNDRKQLEPLLQNRPDLVQQLGSVFHSPIIDVLPVEQMSYEHLEYKPLVVARAHRLGQDRVILNPNLHAQYHRLLDLIAHQNGPTSEQRVQLSYYLVLQNRIEEAMAYFSQVERQELDVQLQYDYLDAYFDFYRGDYDHAYELAGEYANYAVPRWRTLFGQIREQVDQRQALLRGEEAVSSTILAGDSDSSQRILTDGRNQQQTEMAQQTPTLEIDGQGEELWIRHSNVGRIRIHYYLMDLELLFSRKPFVSQKQGASPVIQPNRTDEIMVGPEEGLQTVRLPTEMQNRNVLVEVSAEGIVRSQVMTANALNVTLVEIYGQLQVTRKQGRGPVAGAYVKVYARHRDGRIQFYKDGYTDLRGRFDYASLSTNDLDTVERFAILVMDEGLGAVVQEAAPPTR